MAIAKLKDLFGSDFLRTDGESPRYLLQVLVFPVILKVTPFHFTSGRAAEEWFGTSR